MNFKEMVKALRKRPSSDSHVVVEEQSAQPIEEKWIVFIYNFSIQYKELMHWVHNKMQETKVQ